MNGRKRIDHEFIPKLRSQGGSLNSIEQARSINFQ